MASVRPSGKVRLSPPRGGCRDSHVRVHSGLVALVVMLALTACGSRLDADALGVELDSGYVDCDAATVELVRAWLATQQAVPM